MLTHVPFEELTQVHLRRLAESLITCPEFWRPGPDEMLRAIFKGEAHMFTFEPDGIMVLSVTRNPDLEQRRLMIDGWSGAGSIFSRKGLAKALRRIAADWECDTIETLVFDLRLASAICSIGGRMESICVVLPVVAEEQAHG